MYCHGMATLALAELFGMTGDEEVKKVLKKARGPDRPSGAEPQRRRLAVRAATPTGADISVTIMQVMALRGAKDSGLHVPDKTMKKALGLHQPVLRRVHRRVHVPAGQPGPGLRPDGGRHLRLKLTGEYDKNVDKSVDVPEGQMEYPREHYWYGHYYACHAMYQIGGKDWDDYYALIKKQFLPMQQADGSWSRMDDGQSRRPGLPDGDRRPGPVGAGRLPADLPALI